RANGRSPRGRPRQNHHSGAARPRQNDHSGPRARPPRSRTPQRVPASFRVVISKHREEELARLQVGRSPTPTRARHGLVSPGVRGVRPGRMIVLLSSAFFEGGAHAWARPASSRSEAAAKPSSRTPALRLIQVRCRGPRRARRRLTPELRKSHQTAEPRKTPLASTGALSQRTRSSFWMAMTENMAAKLMMVIGLVMVSRKVEAQARQESLAFAATSESAGGARKVRAPRKTRYA